MRRAIPIETVREYVEQQLAELEPIYEREQARGEHSPDWPVICPRYIWLYWMEKKALRRAERAGVGAVLAVGTGQTLLEQLALLGEQLHAQERIAEPYGTTPVGTVPRDLTEDAVTPYWTAQTAMSASAAGWRRRQKAQEERKRPGLELELRLRYAIHQLGGYRPLPGLENVHRQAQRAAGHLGNWRILQKYEETTERDLKEQLDIAREAAHAAVEAARVAKADTDAAGLEAIARDLDEWTQSHTQAKKKGE